MNRCIYNFINYLGSILLNREAMGYSAHFCRKSTKMSVNITNMYSPAQPPAQRRQSRGLVGKELLLKDLENHKIVLFCVKIVQKL